MSTIDLIGGLPGEKLVRNGLKDFQARRHTIGACLIAIAQSRLSKTGFIPNVPTYLPDPELELYRLLRQQGGDAYSRYNALLRELVSFENALDRRLQARATPQLEICKKLKNHG
jgi:hypothetical protein